MMKEPLPFIEGADLRSFNRFITEPSEYKKIVFGAENENKDFYDLNLILTEDFRFSSEPEFGLEAVDILTNTIRRSMAGNFKRQGWLPIREIMIHRSKHYLGMISLLQNTPPATKYPYANVIRDFRNGGRQMSTKNLFE